ncbi:triose-phosphate isomerase family protein [Jiangella asiatica]|uniref:Triosephosphate isomerase n=1 Tax=Jiangella asiatica TaxID=2530372 RepID=A0A4R5D4U3_9ACTN|nr:triose-phosphate isomerase family protein [Jiangella asiatica]TDE08346.1 triosephosphate isomerase [Jiangella asiatica]
MAAAVAVGVSLKMYFGHRRAAEWCERVAALARAHPAVASGAVGLFVMPTYLQLLPALATFAGTNVRVGAQDVAGHDTGAFTGEVSAAELAEVGVRLAEVGHAERRRLFGETDDDVAAKSAAALRHGLTPVLCVGEADRLATDGAAAAAVAQVHAGLDRTPDGPVIVAYEPVWAIAAAEPAPPAHITAVSRALRTALDTMPGRAGSTVIYGGSAGPGLLTELGVCVDGLFLGRFAHDTDALAAVVDEAATLASRRSPVPDRA